MEHRYGQRSPSKVEALIYSGGRPTAVGHIANFSSSGLFVRTRCRAHRPHQQIEIACHLGDGHTTDRFPAAIVRVDEDGIGVEFDDSDPASLRLAAMLRRNSRPPRLAPRATYHYEGRGARIDPTLRRAEEPRRRS